MVEGPFGRSLLEGPFVDGLLPLKAQPSPPPPPQNIPVSLHTISPSPLHLGFTTFQSSPDLGLGFHTKMMQPGAGIPPPQMHQQQQYQQQPPPPQQWMMPPPQQQQPPQQAFQPQPPQQFWPQQPQAAAVPPPMQMQQQQFSAEQMGGSNEIKSLWIGDLQYFMDENYLYACFAQAGELASVKVIRNKQSGQPEGYGFLEFQSRAAAERVLQTYNGSLMPNSEQTFRLNWATLGAGERRADDGPDYTIFVGDLAAEVTDYLLLETFKPHYTSIKGAKVVTDRATGRTKGYGFVRFGDESEQLRAMSEMNGVLCSSRPMRIGPAATKKPATSQPYQKGHKRLFILGGLELISAEMIPL